MRLPPASHPNHLLKNIQIWGVLAVRWPSRFEGVWEGAGLPAEPQLGRNPGPKPENETFLTPQDSGANPWLNNIQN